MSVGGHLLFRSRTDVRSYCLRGGRTKFMKTTPQAELSRVQTSGLTGGQWMVLLAAFLGWLFDGFEIGLFPVVARPALRNLLGGTGDAGVGEWMGIITACFLLGAA